MKLGLDEPARLLSFYLGLRHHRLLMRQLWTNQGGGRGSKN
jgi:hypothetical protein